MNKYLATVRVKGQTINTIVFADSPFHARLILEFQFGIGSVVSSPTQTSKTCEGYLTLDEAIAAIKPIKPLSPPQARIDSLKKQKYAISTNLKTERNRQKIAKAQQQIRLATSKKSAA